MQYSSRRRLSTANTMAEPSSRNMYASRNTVPKRSAESDDVSTTGRVDMVTTADGTTSPPRLNSTTSRTSA